MNKYKTIITKSMGVHRNDKNAKKNFEKKLKKKS